jgi:hypothetical protein
VGNGVGNGVGHVEPLAMSTLAAQSSTPR